MVWIEHLITGHYGNQVFCIRQVDDIVCPSRNHINRFDLISADLKFYGFPSVYITLLDQSMAMNNDELLPLGVMPVLAFGNAGHGDVDADLSAI